MEISRKIGILKKSAKQFSPQGRLTTRHITNHIIISNERQCHLRHPYFDIMVGLELSYDSQSNACDSVATGRVSNAGQITDDDPDRKGYSGRPG
jgi:hypothetical protein